MSNIAEAATASHADHSDPLLEALGRIVGAAHVVAGIDAPEALTDYRRRYVGRARAVVRPASTAEVAEVVRELAAWGIPVVPQGGHTSLVGGATPDDSGEAVVISLKRLDRVRAVDLDNDTITVEAGLALRKVQDAARDAGRLFPLSLGSEDSSTIGGNLATNAGGVQVLRYGNTRDLTLGLEVVTPEGEIWNGLRGLRKDNSGYDLRDLYIGSEGTLGIITAATLRLFPQPVAQRTAFIKLATIENVLALLNRAREGFGAALTAFELITGPAYALVEHQLPDERLPFAAEPKAERSYVLLEVSDGESEQHAQEALERVVGSAIENGIAIDAVIADSLAQSQALWRLRQVNLAQSQLRDGRVIPHDISVPISQIPQLLRTTEAALQQRFPGVRVFAHGHVGDGNLHYHVARPLAQDESHVAEHENDIRALVHRQVTALGGSISAEHGVGRSKRDDLPHYKTPLELALMQRIKHALDPHGIMNPGKLLQG
ncbi:FAD/FMN-containing dehydrogenase [Rhodopseudomonas rhenobacensis]|uniref:FAD/FMN-containing dehydrogenase n=1 Tax=Rhodopseudomonas rhenobacensis TaxID=87461 RepID=A0A7W8DYJ9_9BRAD|nr:FAD-binding oxidoreductase [Rhodopseudomonas rhenobacensis]MBB5046907.1 FAD/FMN-containing dehydrogenase [Rhodopseudomonas rhenobacensis]